MFPTLSRMFVQTQITAADPGFDLTGGVALPTGVKSLKVLSVDGF